MNYIRLSKQTYWQSLQKSFADEITVRKGSYKGHFSWEFRVSFSDMASEGQTLQVELTKESLKCLKEEEVVKLLISLERCQTLDDVEEKLNQHDFKPEIF